jgi:hypothetical protein
MRYDLKPYAILDCPDQEIITERTLQFLRTQTDIFSQLENLSLWNILDTKQYVRAVPEFAKWARSLGLYINSVYFTVCNSNQNINLHTDLPPNVAKINFPILNTKDTFNCWYKVTDEQLKDYAHTVDTLGYYHFKGADLNDFEKIGEIEMTKPIAFNSQIPHMVRLSEGKHFPRLVLSTIFLKEPLHLLVQ